MIVHVKLYALLRPHHPGPNRSTPLNVELPEGAVARALIPALHLPEQLVRNVFINNAAATLDSILHDGDAVALFPPVVGG